MSLIYGEGREHAVGRLRKKLDKLRQSKIDVASSLSPLDFTGRQTEMNLQRARGTGNWLLDSRQFKSWMDPIFWPV